MTEWNAWRRILHPSAFSSLAFVLVRLRQCSPSIAFAHAQFRDMQPSPSLPSLRSGVWMDGKHPHT